MISPDLLRQAIDRPLPTDPGTRADVEHVLTHGYIILENCLSRHEAGALKAEIDRLTATTPESLQGRNAFEGHRTTRIYSLLNKTRAFDRLVLLPRVRALNDYFLDPGYLLSVITTIQVGAGERAQALHTDDQWIRRPPRPPLRAPLGTGVLAALDDFTPANGATRVVPGSHLWAAGARPPDDADEAAAAAVPASCPAGSCVFFLSTLWHSAGANATSAARYSATVQYCQPYIRQIENQLLAVDVRRLRDIPAQIVDMMGYRMIRPFIGHADGLNPRRAAQRMVARLARPVEEHPETFAHGEVESKL